MADLSKLESALVKADAAGDTEGARALANEIRRMRSFQDVKTEGNVQTPPTPFRPSGETAISGAEEIAANPYTRFAIGAAQPVLGAAQLAANAVGAGAPVNAYLNNLDEIIQRGRQYIGSTGTDAFSLAGQALSPAYLAAASKVAPAATALGRIGQGAGFGALGGLVEPVQNPNYWATKAEQVGGGAVLGATLPAAWELSKGIGRGVRNVVQPYMGKTGADQAAGRLANNIAGNKADEIIGLLQENQTVLPGSNPTAGQAATAANNAEFAALQKIAAERNPSAYYGPQGIEGQQNAARVAALRTIGQDKQALDAAILSRETQAATNYSNAFQQSVKADPKLAQLGKNPFFQDAMKDADKLAEANGINPKQGLTQYLHYIKVSLDKQLSKTGDTALGNTEKMTVQQLKNNLLNWMSAKNPAYEQARADFAAASVPINQMQVGQYLEQKLVPALSEETKQRAATYANALREAPRTIKGSTGQSIYEELGQILRPDQLETARLVQKDLARDATFTDLASKGRAAAMEKIGAAVPDMAPTGMFSPKISVTRSLYNQATGKATNKILDDLSLLMQNPQQLAQVMKDAKPFERRALIDALNRYQAVMGAQAIPSGNNQQGK